MQRSLRNRKGLCRFHDEPSTSSTVGPSSSSAGSSSRHRRKQKKKKKKEQKGKGKKPLRRKDMSPVSSTVADESDDATSAKDTSTSESRRKASTKAYPRFTISESEFLTSLQSHALSRFGFGMASGPASEMVVDVSKYLYFSGKCTRPRHPTGLRNLSSRMK